VNDVLCIIVPLLLAVLAIWLAIRGQKRKKEEEAARIRALEAEQQAVLSKYQKLLSDVHGLTIEETTDGWRLEMKSESDNPAIMLKEARLIEKSLGLVKRQLTLDMKKVRSTYAATNVPRDEREHQASLRKIHLAPYEQIRDTVSTLIEHLGVKKAEMQLEIDKAKQR